MLSIPHQHRTRLDPLLSAAQVDAIELADAIAWTEVYLQGLRDRVAAERIDPDLLRLDSDHDLPRCRFEDYRAGQTDPMPAAHPPREPDSLDITLAEHAHQLIEARQLAANAMQRFHQLHDRGSQSVDYISDDDGHFDRHGHIDEARGL